MQQRISLSDRVQLTLMATVFNVFNQDSPTDYWPGEVRWGNMVQINEATFFEGFDPQQLIEEQGVTREARLLMDLCFRPPRSIRLGVRLGF